jgi:hypothetical protein
MKYERCTVDWEKGFYDFVDGWDGLLDHCGPHTVKFLYRCVSSGFGHRTKVCGLVKKWAYNSENVPSFFI